MSLKPAYRYAWVVFEDCRDEMRALQGDCADANSWYIDDRAGRIFKGGWRVNHDGYLLTVVEVF